MSVDQQLCLKQTVKTLHNFLSNSVCIIQYNTGDILLYHSIMYLLQIFILSHIVIVSDYYKLKIKLRLIFHME